MVRHAHGHRHLRRTAKKGAFDYLLYFFMVATPMFEVAQAWQIFVKKSAGDVSLTTWGFFFLSSIAWFIYAVRSRLKPLMVAYGLFLVAEGLTVVAILVYS